MIGRFNLHTGPQHRLINPHTGLPSLSAQEDIAMAQPNVEDVVKAIAADTNTPAETVSKMYADTWAEYSEGARNNGLPGSSRRKTRSQKICAACLNRGTET